jgi:hypothetical protein
MALPPVFEWGQLLLYTCGIVPTHVGIGIFGGSPFSPILTPLYTSGLGQTQCAIPGLQDHPFLPPVYGRDHTNPSGDDGFAGFPFSLPVYGR